MNWTKWTPPYDPRKVSGAKAVQDENGGFTEFADCGILCPGCGICCDDRFLDSGGGGSDADYKSGCDDSCPAYGNCCPPFDLRKGPENIDDAHSILLERDNGQRWEIQDALMILAHEGTAEAIEILEKAISSLPQSIKGFGDCALDECRYFSTIPRNEEEELMMLKKEVLDSWENRAVQAQIKIDEEILSDLAKYRYELKITERLLAKADDKESRDTWRIQADVVKMSVIKNENALEEEEKELVLCDLMISEIQADIDNSNDK